MPITHSSLKQFVFLTALLLLSVRAAQAAPSKLSEFLNSHLGHVVLSSEAGEILTAGLLGNGARDPKSLARLLRSSEMRSQSYEVQQHFSEIKLRAQKLIPEDRFAEYMKKWDPINGPMNYDDMIIVQRIANRTMDNEFLEYVSARKAENYSAKVKKFMRGR